MASEDDTPRDHMSLPGLDPDHVLDLLKRRGVRSLACPACGSKEWDGLTDTFLPIAQDRNPRTGEIGSVPASIHAISMSCATCGYTALFNRQFIGD